MSSLGSLGSLLLTLGLAACGGGDGGGESSPQAVPAPVIQPCTNGANNPPLWTEFPAPTVQVSNAAPAANATGVSITGELAVTLTLSNVESLDATATYCGRTASSRNVTASVLDGVGKVTVLYTDPLPYGQECAWEVRGTAHGKNSQTMGWSYTSRFTTEASGATLRYQDKVYLLKGLAYSVEPKADGGYSFIQLGNESSHRTTSFPGLSIGDCIRNLRKTPAGLIWLSCVTNDDGLRRNLVLNPLRQILRDPVADDGAEPALSDAGWVQSAPYDATVLPEWRFKAKTSAGWFVANNPPTTAKFIDNAGKVTTLWDEPNAVTPIGELFFVVSN